ncbi:hypothetical protein GCM10027168_08630 [Streptomyces capparidis]
MTLRKLGKDPESKLDGSPTVYLDEERDTYLIQSWKVTDPERLSRLELPDDETVVELPRRMMRFFLEVGGDGAAADE